MAKLAKLRAKRTRPFSEREASIGLASTSGTVKLLGTMKLPGPEEGAVWRFLGYCEPVPAAVH